jgi:DNA-binding transcriptional LysR family regulator
LLQNLKDINWNHLYYFYEVSRLQSLKKTAEALGLAPSTLSEKLKKLEQSFERRLFKRSSKGLMLTDEGQKLYERVYKLFEDGSRLLEHYSVNAVGGYAVNVGIEETVLNDVATDFALQYWDLYAEFGTVNTIRKYEHDILVEDLISGNIDWGISLRKPKRRSLGWAEIDSFELVFCCAEELFDKFKDKKDIIANIPFRESNRDKTLNFVIYQYLRKQGVLPKEKIYSDHPDFIKKLCQRGRCVTFMPENPNDNYDGLKMFKLEQPLRISVYAIWKKSEEGLVSIQKLRHLIEASALPKNYEDIDFQIEASNISKDLLK